MELKRVPLAEVRLAFEAHRFGAFPAASKAAMRSRMPPH